MAFTGPTIDAFKPLIQRPTLKPDLLAKPPYRFLHDIVTSLMKATGFPPAGIFDDALMNPATATKEQKLAFLEKLIAAIAVANGSPVDCRPIKVIAGQEPENTNLMLQALAAAAAKVGSLDLNAIVNSVNGAAAAPSAPPAPRTEASADAKAAADKAAQDAAAQEAAAAQAQAAAAAAAKAKEEDERKQKAEAAAKRKAEDDRKKAEAAAKAQAAAAAAAAASASNSASASSATGSDDGALPVTRQVRSIAPAAAGEDAAKATQRCFAGLIDKPKLTTPLLQKPPLRFIHDIVTNTLRVTGCPEGLYEPELLVADNVKDPATKLLFLSKLIEFTSVCNNCDPPLMDVVDPRMIAAGREWEKTNLLLQQFAIAAASGIDCAAVLARMAARKAGGKAKGSSAMSPTAAAPGGPASPSAAEDNAASAAKEQKEREQAEQQQRKKDEAAAAARAKAEADSSAPAGGKSRGGASSGPVAAAPVAAVALPKLPLADLTQAKDDDAPNFAQASEGGEMKLTKLQRPLSARPPPPKVKETHLVDEDARDKKDKKQANTKPDEKKSEPKEPAVAAASGVIKEGEQVVEEEEIDEEPDNGGQNVQFTDAQGGDKFGGAGGGDEKDQGILMRKIREEQRKVQPKKEEKKGAGIAITAKLGAAGGKSSKEQINDLRSAIQKLCQSVNPLGKCMEFVYDDMEMMNKEFARWRAEYTKYCDQLEAERRTTNSQLEPLQNQLADVEAAIAEQKRKTHQLKAQILRNDATVKQLLESRSQMD